MDGRSGQNRAVIVLTIAAATAGLLVGCAARRWLVAGRWRRDGEAQALPRRWEPVGLALAWAVAIPVLHPADILAFWPAYAVLACAGVALASIDLAVHRLPDVLTLGAVPVVGVLLLFASALTGQWSRWLDVMWAVAVAAPFLVVVALGGMGLGDVKLGLLLTFALAWLSLPTALLGLILGFVVGGVWACVLLVSGRARRGTRFAYGPSMLLGSVASFVVLGNG